MARLGDSREKPSAGAPEAESGEVAGGEVGEDDEGAVAVSVELAEHLEEEADEAGIDGGEVGLAVVEGEGGEPFEYGGPRVRVRVWIGRGGGMGVGIVEGDVGGERVDELVLGNSGIVRGFRVWFRHFFDSETPERSRGGERNGERIGEKWAPV